jgi:hypothetical protein
MFNLWGMPVKEPWACQIWHQKKYIYGAFEILFMYIYIVLNIVS